MTAVVTPGDWLRLRGETVDTIPAVVEKVGLPSVLLPYQQRAVGLLDSAGVNVLVIEKSRRIGLTWGLAASAVLRAGRARSARGMDVMYISYSQEMTREFIDACAMWARAFSIAAGAATEMLFDDGMEGGETRSIKAFRIGFASGFEIVGLSSAPRSLRGKQGVVIIDEAAFVDQLSELLKAALAFLMWGGQVVVCSTHDGVDNPFNRMVQDILGGRSKYRHMRIDFDDALRDGLYRRICLVKGDEWSEAAEHAWRQEIVDFYGDGADEELFCIPSLGSGAWLSAPLIESRMGDGCPVLRFEFPADFLQRSGTEQHERTAAMMAAVAEAVSLFNPEGQHALGFDFARHADLSVVIVLAIGERLERRAALIVEMRRVPYSEQEAVVKAIIASMPRPVGAAFDATGSGEYIAEALARLHGAAGKDGAGGGMIAAVKLSLDWYRTEMPPLKTAFEDDLIALPRDAELLADLRLVKVVRGIPQVPPLRTGEKGAKRHGDAAVALALAYHASRMRFAEYAYRGVGAGAGTAGGFDRPRRDDDRRSPWRRPLGSEFRGSM